MVSSTAHERATYAAEFVYPSLRELDSGQVVGMNVVGVEVEPPARERAAVLCAKLEALLVALGAAGLVPVEVLVAVGTSC